ncbi:MAG: HAMP domain-containing sensor histidine kinase [Verrucomicrobiota bacterium]
MRKPAEKPTTYNPASWWWTVALFSLSAILVAAASVILSTQTDRISVKPPGNGADDSFRQIARRVDEMERLWQSALEKEAQRLLAAGSTERAIEVSGVSQYSRLNANLSDTARAHTRADGAAPTIKPVLAKFARKEPGEWVFSESQILTNSGWIEMPDRPLAWWQGNGRAAVVLLLDTREASAVVAADLQGRFKSAAAGPGVLAWEGPSGKTWLANGELPQDAKPDEILRHVSRFGDWTLRRFYPVTVTTHYKLPVLLGGFTLAGLLLAGGVAIVSWQRKATRLAEQRVSFVNRVSHELRTPLTNLLLNTDLALDGLAADDGKARRRLGLIREETARLSRIVDNVQTFARMEKGKPEFHSTLCDVEKVISELMEIFAPLFERKSITCDCICDVATPIPLDRDAFSQIVSNLLSNVEKYAGEGARASLTVSIKGDELIAEVADNGPGIPASSRQRVFLAFERVGSRVDEGATGTGLGLTISRDLAIRMGGSLDLIDAALFRLTLPLERSPA